MSWLSGNNPFYLCEDKALIKKHRDAYDKHRNKADSMLSKSREFNSDTSDPYKGIQKASLNKIYFAAKGDKKTVAGYDKRIKDHNSHMKAISDYRYHYQNLAKKHYDAADHHWDSIGHLESGDAEKYKQSSKKAKAQSEKAYAVNSKASSEPHVAAISRASEKSSRHFTKDPKDKHYLPEPEGILGTDYHEHEKLAKSNLPDHIKKAHSEVVQAFDRLYDADHERINYWDDSYDDAHWHDKEREYEHASRDADEIQHHALGLQHGHEDKVRKEKQKANEFSKTANDPHEKNFEKQADKHVEKIKSDAVKKPPLGHDSHEEYHLHHIAKQEQELQKHGLILRGIQRAGGKGLERQKKMQATQELKQQHTDAHKMHMNGHPDAVQNTHDLAKKLGHK